jgi:hypothetical protein
VAGQHRARRSTRSPDFDAAHSAPDIAQAVGPGVEVDEPLTEALHKRQAEAQDPRLQGTARLRGVGTRGTCVKRVAGVALSGEGGEEADVVGCCGVQGRGRGEVDVGKLLGYRCAHGRRRRMCSLVLLGF